MHRVRFESKGYEISTPSKNCHAMRTQLSGSSPNPGLLDFSGDFTPMSLTDYISDQLQLVNNFNLSPPLGDQGGAAKSQPPNHALVFLVQLPL